MKELRIVLNQCGASIELHGHREWGIDRAARGEEFCSLMRAFSGAEFVGVGGSGVMSACNMDEEVVKPCDERTQRWEVLMACTVENRRLYCTTADVSFGPLFESDADAERFMFWCNRTHGDPRKFSSIELEKLVSEWKLTRDVQEQVTEEIVYNA